MHKIEVLVLQKITLNIPSCSVAFNQDWKHLSNLTLADPEFGVPGSVDILLGADVFSRTVLHGRRFGPSGSPSAIKTTFGWVLAGSVRAAGIRSEQQEDNCCLAITSPDDLLRRFWEVEDYNLQQPLLSTEEQTVATHFERNHSRDKTGRFIVPLPMKKDMTLLGESRSLAVKRFKALECSLRVRSQSKEFADAVPKHFDTRHAKLMPVVDLSKPRDEVQYFPLHAMCKKMSFSNKVQVVFDASVKTMSGTSLNDHLLVGHTGYNVPCNNRRSTMLSTSPSCLDNKCQ